MSVDQNLVFITVMHLMVYGS